VKSIKKAIFFLWVASVLAALVYVLIYPELLSTEFLVNLITRFENQLLLAFFLISILRGLFLIPSTPFVLTGILLFPAMPWIVLVISMIGILLTATGLYYFADMLGFSEKLDKKFPEKMKIWHKRLNSPKATLIVLAWSFFPLVPTDLICYVAGIVKMPFKYLMLGVFVGEAILVSFYVFVGQGIFQYLFA
jgi:uncharacterized membrane protein YdjX (TVP38/TMEM64 family)